jgi:hypothetical protein
LVIITTETKDHKWSLNETLGDSPCL